MKKPILFLFLLCSSLHSVSQKRISTKDYPYQVLFVDEASIFGKKVKQYDYVTNNDLINVEGSITIFRYDYKVFTLNPGKYWVDEIVKERPQNCSDRPLLDPKAEYKNPQSPPFSHSTCPSYNKIELVVPSEDNNQFYREDVIDLGWVLTDGEKLYQSFIVQFSNIYDEEIRTVEVENNFFSFRSDTLDSNKNDTINLDDGLLIVSIHRKHNAEFTSGDFGFKLYHQDEEFLTKAVDENYFELLEAIYYDHINDNRRANLLYQEQVRKSYQDPRFIKLYEDFLERNPQFK